MAVAAADAPRVDQLDAEQAILALLLSPDGKKDNGEWRWNAPVEGKTRLVKELFLVDREVAPAASPKFTFRFTPGPYGPSSLALTNTLQRLILEGKVASRPFAGGRGAILSIAPAGAQEAKATWSRLRPDARSAFYRLKSRVKEMDYRQLLVYVYRTFPEYTENSLIREEILGDQPE